LNEQATPAPRRDRFPLLLGAAVVLVLVLVGAAGLRSWADLAAQRAREAELEAAIARTEGDVGRLEERIRRLGDDPVTLERLARQDLGLVRPEDVVYVFTAPAPGARPLPSLAPLPSPTPSPAATSPSPPAGGGAAAPSPAPSPPDEARATASPPPAATPSPSLLPST
jgi:cell division protein FtsB